MTKFHVVMVSVPGAVGEQVREATPPQGAVRHVSSDEAGEVVRAAGDLPGASPHVHVGLNTAPSPPPVLTAGRASRFVAGKVGRAGIRGTSSSQDFWKSR